MDSLINDLRLHLDEMDSLLIVLEGFLEDTETATEVVKCFSACSSLLLSDESGSDSIAECADRAVLLCKTASPTMMDEAYPLLLECNEFLHEYRRSLEQNESAPDASEISEKLKVASETLGTPSMEAIAELHSYLEEMDAMLIVLEGFSEDVDTAQSVSSSFQDCAKLLATRERKNNEFGSIAFDASAICDAYAGKDIQSVFPLLIECNEILHDYRRSLENKTEMPATKDIVSKLESAKDAVPEATHLDQENISGESAKQEIEVQVEASSKQSDNTELDVNPELLKGFIEECTDHLEDIEAHVLELDDDSGNESSLDAIFRAFHTIKGTATYFGLHGMGSLAHVVEDLLDEVRAGTRPFSGQLGGLILESRDILTHMVEYADETGHDSPCPPEMLQKIKFFAENKVYEEEATTTAGSSETMAADESLEQAIIAPTPESPDQPVVQAASSNKQPNKRSREIVKVEATRLDALVDLVGELVIAQSISAESLNEMDSLPEALDTSLKRLTTITRDLQSLSTSLRMVPIGPVFQRMKRLVRDLMKQTGKTIEFEILGENTEVDKSLVDAIADPLVHLIRNAVDHGIENSEDRPPWKGSAGKLSLTAYQRGSWIYIDLKDDGKGLDKDAILAKAMERGMADPDTSYTEKEIFDFITKAGFSTAAKITDVSGRGVGMDVVVQSINALKGQLDINSTKGEGSTFTLRLPLTMAIIDGVVAQVGEERYIIPAPSIVQTVRKEGLTTSSVAGDEEVLVYRNSTIPLVSLADVFHIESAKSLSDDSLFIVLDDEEYKFALLVDELVGKQQVVIKSLDSILKNSNGVSGSAIMPDGEVGLIIDVQWIGKNIQQRIEDQVTA
ncbi:MAG: chemotaxis protein CheA [Pseudomonadales bacterium]|nr:chemotaxis protein CheA [Pseudomonadales bacterium]